MKILLLMRELQTESVRNLNELTLDLFKCLIFVQGLTDNKDAEMRSRILAKLDIDPKLTL